MFSTVRIISVEQIFLSARRNIFCCAILLAALLSCLSNARATENGASAWPVGAESVAMATSVPHKGQTNFYEYTVLYAANELADAHGAKAPVPEFKLRVFAVAGKLSHNWGVPFLCGELGSWIAVPYFYEQLHLPGERSTKNAIGNVNIVPFSVLYHEKNVHWYYELQFLTTGSAYEHGAALNIGQNNMGLAPAAGLTIVPRRFLKEVGVRADYLINNPNRATHYHSGNEFFTQFDARKEVFHDKVSLGLIGYFYQQTTDDTVKGAPVVSMNSDGSKSIGYRGRVFDLGSQVTMPIGKSGGMAFKWDHDMLVQNKPRGNAFWFQFSIPFSYFHHVR